MKEKVAYILVCHFSLNMMVHTNSLLHKSWFCLPKWKLAQLYFQDDINALSKYVPSTEILFYHRSHLWKESMLTQASTFYRSSHFKTPSTCCKTYSLVADTRDYGRILFNSDAVCSSKDFGPFHVYEQNKTRPQHCKWLKDSPLRITKVSRKSLNKKYDALNLTGKWLPSNYWKIL